MDLFRRCMEPVEKVLRVSLLHLMLCTWPAAQEGSHAVLVQGVLY